MTSAIVIALAVAWTILAFPAQAAPAPRLTLTGPEQVALGEEILVGARLVGSDGRPLSGAVIELRQVGAVGERVIAEETTDGQGSASFVHREYTVPLLTLRAVVRGGAGQAASADVVVSVSGIELPPSVVMAHAPGPAIKTALVLLLGSVWLTYLYAASRVAHVAIEGRRTPIRGGRTR